jgi:small subunit ribosomal protein S20
VARSISSQKALRRSKARAERNKARRSQIKTSIRKVNDAISARDPDAAEQAYRRAARILDRNATRLTVHPNTAARRKSRLAKRINALVAASGK